MSGLNFAVHVLCTSSPAPRSKCDHLPSPPSQPTATDGGWTERFTTTKSGCTKKKTCPRKNTSEARGLLRAVKLNVENRFFRVHVSVLVEAVLVPVMVISNAQMPNGGVTQQLLLSATRQWERSKRVY
uniref:Uncharacterized protein n=1 Tax=Eutreptiella gymnastica TaxID=73025 RepID=A0A7S4D3G5_9EUGL